MNGRRQVWNVGYYRVVSNGVESVIKNTGVLI